MEGEKGGRQKVPIVDCSIPEGVDKVPGEKASCLEHNIGRRKVKCLKAKQGKFKMVLGYDLGLYSMVVISKKALIGRFMSH